MRAGRLGPFCGGRTTSTPEATIWWRIVRVELTFAPFLAEGASAEKLRLIMVFKGVLNFWQRENGKKEEEVSTASAGPAHRLGQL